MISNFLGNKEIVIMRPAIKYYTSATRTEAMQKKSSIGLFGPTKYTFLKVNHEHSQALNAVVKQVGIEHEKRLNQNHIRSIVTYTLSEEKAADGSNEASAFENETFRKIFVTAAAAFASQMGISLQLNDVNKIILEKTVDFEKERLASRLSISLSPSGVNRLWFLLDNDPRFKSLIVK